MIELHGSNLWGVEGNSILKRLIDQGQASRSTFPSLRVIHFINTSRSPGISELNDEPILVILGRILCH